VVETALAAGVGCVQLREKDVSTGELLLLAVGLRELTSRCGAAFVVNGRPDVVIASEADGVHLGAASVPIEDARGLLGHDRVIGYSAHSIEEAKQAETQGADYVFLSPIFMTRKPYRVDPIGLEPLERAVAALRIPVIALGGVVPDNAGLVAATGAAGIAVISAICAAADPGLASRQLLDSFRSGKQGEEE